MLALHSREMYHNNLATELHTSYKRAQFTTHGPHQMNGSLTLNVCVGPL